MLVPPLHPEEARRVEALRGLGLLDTPPEDRFDRLTRLAAAVFGAPIALVGLVDQDRQWFKSRQGLEAWDLPREISFCGHTILGAGPFVVPDALQDPRFHDNPLVTAGPGLRFYAGQPLTAPGGLPVGALCVFDRAAHAPTPAQLAALADLGQLVEQELAAADLQTVRAVHQTVVETLSEAVVLQNREGAIVMASRRACDILGLTLDQMLGRTSLDPAWHCIHEDGTPWPGDAHPSMRTLATGLPQQDVLMGVHKPDGTLTWIRINTQPVRSGPEHLIGGVVCSYRDVTLERWSEESLARKDLRFHTLAAKAPVGIFEADGGGLNTWVNDRWCELAGMSLPQALGEGWSEALHPEDRDRVVAAWVAAASAGEDFRIRHRFLRPDGSIRWVNVRASPLQDGGGYLGTLQDITVEVLALEELGHQEALYRLLVERTTDIIARHDLAGIFRFVTPSVTQVLGYTPGEMVGQLPTAFLEPKDVPVMVAAHAALLQGQPVGTFRFRARHKDGGLVWLETEGNAVVDPATGQITETVFTSRDISFRVAAEQDLQETTTRYRAIMEAIPDELLRQDAEGVYIDAHSGHTGWSDWPVESLIGRPMEDFLPPEVVRIRKGAIRRALVSGEPQVVEYRLEQGGRLLDFEARVVPAGTSEVVAMVRDVTARNLADRMKTEFVSTVSHELRTPLTAIRGALGLLAGGAAGSLPGQAQELLALGQKNTDRLIQLINDLLDLEKIQRGKLDYHLQVVDLDPLGRQAQAVLQPMAAVGQVGLSFVPPVAPVLARVDPDRLAQVLANLLSNAIKFSPPDGVVTLRLRAHGGMARFEVEDGGPGIPPEFQARIFQPFTQADGSTTRKIGGTGLGLSIAKALVERMEGALGYATEPGRTLFWVDLPRADA